MPESPELAALLRQEQALTAEIYHYEHPSPYMMPGFADGWFHDDAKKALIAVRAEIAKLNAPQNKNASQQPTAAAVQAALSPGATGAYIGVLLDYIAALEHDQEAYRQNQAGHELDCAVYAAREMAFKEALQGLLHQSRPMDVLSEGINTSRSNSRDHIQDAATKLNITLE